MPVLTAILLLIALKTGSCRTADGQLLDNKVVPRVDHHQNLLSPAGAALQNAYTRLLFTSVEIEVMGGSTQKSS